MWIIERIVFIGRAGVDWGAWIVFARLSDRRRNHNMRVYIKDWHNQS